MFAYLAHRKKLNFKWFELGLAVDIALTITIIWHLFT